MKKSRLFLAAAVVAAVALIALTVATRLAPAQIGSATSAASFRAMCGLAGGTVGTRSYGMGGDTLVCFSRSRTRDADKQCTFGRDSCEGECYTSFSNATMIADIEVGGASGKCSEHRELGTYSLKAGETP